jgi:exopolysaccharide biosynthesis polyprenyl glycosylphosphotransferase
VEISTVEPISKALTPDPVPGVATPLSISIAELKRTPRGHHFEAWHSALDFGFSLLINVILVESIRVSHVAQAVPLIELLLAFPVMIVVFGWQRRLYRRFADFGNIKDALAIVNAVGLASLSLAAWLYVQRVSFAPGNLARIFILNVAVLLAWRLVARYLYARAVFAGKAGTNILIVGSGHKAKALAQFLQSNRHLGYVVKGFLDDANIADKEVLGGLRDLPRIARDEYVDEIFVTATREPEARHQLLATARCLRLNITIVPELDELASQTRFEYVGDSPVVELHCEPIPKLGLLVKRLFDIVFVLGTAIVSVPLIIALGFMVRLDSPGPIFYTSKRVGRKGRRFDFYKLRSMVSNAEALREELEPLNERDSVLFKMKNDPRVTRVGRFMRKFSLDELPQLLNVLKGDMSLVGPRPPLVSEFAKYKLAHKRRLDVSPGITGLWQVSGRKDPSFEGYLALDVKYIENWNLLLDFEILLRTIPAVLRGTGN